MLLLIAVSPRASGYATLLQRGCSEEVEILGSFAAAVSVLDHRHYSGIMIDREMVRIDRAGNSRLLYACGTLCPVYLDFASSEPELIIQKMAKAFSTHNEQLAMRAAASRVRNQLRSSVEGILLSSELAMAVPELPRAAHVKIKFVHDLAKGMSRQLQP